MHVNTEQFSIHMRANDDIHPNETQITSWYFWLLIFDQTEYQSIHWLHCLFHSRQSDTIHLVHMQIYRTYVCRPSPSKIHQWFFSRCWFNWLEIVNMYNGWLQSRILHAFIYMCKSISFDWDAFCFFFFCIFAFLSIFMLLLQASTIDHFIRN